MFQFSDATNIYKKYNKEYNVHKKGYVILGPPGIGKTTFVHNQSGIKKNWIDQDDLFIDLNVKWHFNESEPNQYKLNYLRCDYISEQSKLFGYRLIGSLFFEYEADAIVIIPLELHKKYLKNRKDLDFNTVMKTREILIQHASKYKIPLFDNINDAVTYLEEL